eukprot:782574-Amphidinium_carterae.2
MLIWQAQDLVLSLNYQVHVLCKKSERSIIWSNKLDGDKEWNEADTPQDIGKHGMPSCSSTIYFCSLRGGL